MESDSISTSNAGLARSLAAGRRRIVQRARRVGFIVGAICGSSAAIASLGAGALLGVAACADCLTRSGAVRGLIVVAASATIGAVAMSWRRRRRADRDWPRLWDRVCELDDVAMTARELLAMPHGIWSRGQQDFQLAALRDLDRQLAVAPTAPSLRIAMPLVWRGPLTVVIAAIVFVAIAKAKDASVLEPVDSRPVARPALPLPTELAERWSRLSKDGVPDAFFESKPRRPSEWQRQRAALDDWQSRVESEASARLEASHILEPIAALGGLAEWLSTGEVDIDRLPARSLSPSEIAALERAARRLAQVPSLRDASAWLSEFDRGSRQAPPLSDLASSWQTARATTSWLDSIDGLTASIRDLELAAGGSQHDSEDRTSSESAESAAEPLVAHRDPAEVHLEPPVRRDTGENKAAGFDRVARLGAPTLPPSDWLELLSRREIEAHWFDVIDAYRIAMSKRSTDPAQPAPNRESER